MIKVVVGIPEDMLSLLDDYVDEKGTRAEVIREACTLLIREKKRLTMVESMKNGYLEMAEINRLLAEEIACDFDCVPREINYVHIRSR